MSIFREYYKSNVFVINDLLKDVNTVSFNSLVEFIEKIHVKTNFLQYHGLITAVLLKDVNTVSFYSLVEFIEKIHVKTNFLQYHGLITAVKEFLFGISFKRQKGSKIFYDVLIKSDLIPTGVRKWNSVFNEIDKPIWEKYFKMPFLVTFNTKLNKEKR